MAIKKNTRSAPHYSAEKELTFDGYNIFGEHDRRMFESKTLFDSDIGRIEDRFPHLIVTRPADLLGEAGCFYLLDRDNVIIAILNSQGTYIRKTKPILYRGTTCPCPFFPTDGDDFLTDPIVEALKAYAWSKSLWPEIRRRIIASDYCRRPLAFWVDMDGQMP